jgi:hypothetical protein
MSSIFDLAASIARARARLGDGPIRRRARSDRGTLRVAPGVVAALHGLLSGEEYPGVPWIMAELGQLCRTQSWPCPSRATVYKLIQRDVGPSHLIGELLPSARAALYNLPLAPSVAVPGAQLAFYCFNYGDLAAMHFAAGLPWLPLYQAYRMRGWRAQGLGLLRAVLAARGIRHA